MGPADARRKLRHGQMYADGQVRVAKGENRTAREVSEACKTTIRAARARGSAVHARHIQSR